MNQYSLGIQKVKVKDAQQYGEILDIGQQKNAGGYIIGSVKLQEVICFSFSHILLGQTTVNLDF